MVKVASLCIFPINWRIFTQYSLADFSRQITWINTSISGPRHSSFLYLSPNIKNKYLLSYDDVNMISNREKQNNQL